MDFRCPISSELAALLNRNPGLLQNQSQIGGSLGFAGTEALGLSNSSNISSLLASIILQQQAEERQKALLIQQLALLGSGSYGLTSFAAPSPADTLAQLFQQRQQLESVQAEQAQLDRLAALKAIAASDPALRPTSSPDKLGDLAKILQTQQYHEQQDADNILQKASPTDGKRKGRTGSFPQKLHQILQELERQDGGAAIASFLPHGRAFAIHKPRDFVKTIMPKYFRMSRFSSFQRQLNLYDFQRITTEGPDKGAYYHELFVKDRPSLSTMMKRNKIKGMKNVEDSSHNEEEDEEKKN